MKKVQFGIKLDPDLIARADAVRGNSSRAHWIECAIRLALTTPPDAAGIISGTAIIANSPLKKPKRDG